MNAVPQPPPLEAPRSAIDMLNAVLAQAQLACCAAVDSMVPTLASVVNFEQQNAPCFGTNGYWLE